MLFFRFLILSLFFNLNIFGGELNLGNAINNGDQISLANPIKEAKLVLFWVLWNNFDNASDNSKNIDAAISDLKNEYESSYESLGEEYFIREANNILKIIYLLKINN